MAGAEIYRVEIPIVVDDQTEAPISSVGRRLSKLEQSALKTNTRIRRIFGREISLRISAIDKAWPVIRSVQTRLRSLTGKVWNVTLQAKDKITGIIKNIISKLTSPLALLGAGAGAGAAIFFPLKLAGEMEQAGIAMEFFTESAEKGQEFMKRLQEFAAKTPFEFPDVRDAAVGLMPLYKNMYGVDKAMEETMRTIAAFGNAAGLTGAGIQGMNLAMLGFRQIGTIGKLSMEELRQVTENLMIPMNIILDELGLTGDALDNLAREGIDAKTAMEGIVRALEKNFTGGMEKMSRSLLGLTSTIKDTASLTVWHFGAGMAVPVKRVLLDIVGLTDDTGGKFEEFQKKLEGVGERVGEYFENNYTRIKEFWGELSADPVFQKLDFGDKILYLLNLALDKVDAWLDGEGGEKLEKTLAKVGDIAAKTWFKGFTGLGERTVKNIREGDFKGALVPGALMWMLGGGALARGAWWLGKGIFGAGKWALSKFGLGAAGAAAAKTATTAAETAAVTASRVTGVAKYIYGPRGEILKAITPAATIAGAASTTSRALSILSKFSNFAGKVAAPLAVVGEIASVATAADKIHAATQGAAGLTGMWGGGKLGAAIGTAIFPGIGTVVGGALGSLGGYLAGRFLGGKIVDTARDSTARDSTSAIPVSSGKQPQIVIEVKAESKPTYHIETAVDADQVLRIIRANEKTIADQLADDISRKLEKSFNNMPLGSVVG